MVDKDFWKLVAENLGVELEEEFKVKGLDMPFKVTQVGIRLYMNSEWVQPVPELEVGILHKTIPLIPKPWKPTYGETYYYVDLDANCADDLTWYDDSRDERQYRAHNCFKTWIEAVDKLKKIQEVLKGGK